MAKTKAKPKAKTATKTQGQSPVTLVNVIYELLDAVAAKYGKSDEAIAALEAEWPDLAEAYRDAKEVMTRLFGEDYDDTDE